MIRTVIVDDEPATRERYCDLVSEYGFPFSVAGSFSSAREAIAHWGDSHPQVLLTDIRMPQMSGLELVEKLRTTGWEGIAVVISGYGEFSLAQDAIRAGVFEYLLKPVFPEDLSKLLDRVAGEALGVAGMLSHRVLENVDLEALPAFVRKAIEYAESHLEEHISLGDAADAACVSSSYLSAAFTRECGLSFIDFLHRVRVENAKELLRKRDLSLLDVAEMCGLSDKSYLSRIFKKVTGTSPGAYRRSCLEDAVASVSDKD